MAWKLGNWICVCVYYAVLIHVFIKCHSSENLTFYMSSRKPYRLDSDLSNKFAFVDWHAPKSLKEATKIPVVYL